MDGSIGIIDDESCDLFFVLFPFPFLWHGLVQLGQEFDKRGFISNEEIFSQ